MNHGAYHSPARLGAIVSAYTGHILGDVQPLLDYAAELMGRPVPFDELARLHKQLQDAALPDYLALGAWCKDPPISDSELDAAMALCQTVLNDELPPAPWSVDDLGGGEARVLDAKGGPLFTAERYEATTNTAVARMFAAARLLLPSFAAVVQELRVRIWLREREHDRDMAAERVNTDAAELATRNAEATCAGPYCPTCGRGECH